MDMHDKVGYFQNINFAGRVSFDFTLMEKKLEGEDKLKQLADFVAKNAEAYSSKNNGDVKAIIEFITKRSAVDFANAAKDHSVLNQYQFLMLTGTILEPRRRQVEGWLKCKKWLKEHPKVLLISTQVVEAGVDIDMDIGFKDSSLIDSDEQLAGRVNRNAGKTDNRVYLFNLDNESIVYKKDERLKLQREELNLEEHKKILEQKDFNRVYNRIIEKHVKNRQELIRYFDSYLEHLRMLRFTEVNHEFQLIEDNTVSLYIPLSIPRSAFSKQEEQLLNSLKITEIANGCISGENIFKVYEQVVFNRSDNFILNHDRMCQIQSLLSKFTISVYPQTAKRIEEIEIEKYMQAEPICYGYLYCSGYKDYYDYEIGLQLPKNEKKSIVDFI